MPAPKFEMRGEVPVYFSGVLDKIEGVAHAFPCRTGSPTERLSTLAGRMKSSFGLRKIVTVNQVHRTAVAVYDEDVEVTENFGKKKADAVITAQCCVAVGVRTADCLPILLTDKSARAVGAVHAGWKGLAAGIIPAAIEVMTDMYKVDRGNIHAAVGPHIGPCCYETGPEVAELYSEKFGDDVLRPGEGDRNYLDLGKAANKSLVSCGLKSENVDVMDMCTSCNNERFYSYRRDGEGTGRQLSFIVQR